jgi:hypothetical protein
VCLASPVCWSIFNILAQEGVRSYECINDGGLKVAVTVFGIGRS